MNHIEEKWNWGMLSKHRAAMMGVAIITIILYHGNKTKMIFGGPFGLLDWMLSNGNIGVEIFLFLSGFGLYVSFSRNQSVINFYKKRLLRVVIPYLLLGGSFLVAEDLIRVHMKRKSGLYIVKDFTHFFSDLTLWSFWSDGSKKFWYIALIIVLYLLFPVFYHTIFPKNQRKNSGIRWLCWLVVMIVAIIWIRSHHLSWYQSTEIALTRFPIFLGGVFCGPKIVSKEPVNKKDGLVLAILVAIGGYFVATHHFSGIYRRYYFTVVSVFLCALLSILLDVIQKLFKKEASGIMVEA
ncbi:MAG: acyltransferase [Eubacteriales bacterium]|nr:acyltransferase [Eubacteriales bacterium]